MAGLAVGSRKAEALAFICDRYLAGRDASMVEIARHLGVSKERARQLVGVLARDGDVNRAPGAQRAIIPTRLSRQDVLQALRARGFVIDDDVEDLPKAKVAAARLMPHECAHDH